MITTYLISDIKDTPSFAELTKTIYKNIVNLKYDYPDFDKWYFNKVIPDINAGHRDIIISSYKDKFSGIAILKNKQDEKKICTLYVFKDFKSRGIGKSLFEKSFELLQNDKPLITIPEHKIHQFTPLLKYYDFELTEICPDYYVIGKKEYVYNKRLSQPKLSFIKRNFVNNVSATMK